MNRKRSKTHFYHYFGCWLSAKCGKIGGVNGEGGSALFETEKEIAGRQDYSWLGAELVGLMSGVNTNSSRSNTHSASLHLLSTDTKPPTD